MHQILQSYLRRLTNLSGSNRSLLLMRLIADHFIDLHEFDFINNQPSFDLIQQLIAKKTKISLGKTLDSRDEKTNINSRHLKRLDRTDKFIFEERGSQDLYVGWPFVRGKLIDGSPIRCPLIFFPVYLELTNNEWFLKLREDVNISLNKSFLLAYAYFNQIDLDESLIEHVFDDYEKDSRVFRTHLYQLFKDSPVEINFNQENFLDTLIPFQNFTKPEFDENHKDGELKLYPEAVIGIFPQAGSYLVPDYRHLIENSRIDDIEEFFLSRTIEDQAIQKKDMVGYFDVLKKIKEDQIFTPFQIDAYQESAVKAVKRGNSIVVQGPPGSGKSQLICNLIADFIARGKRVLLVSQKKVALDVVYNRLAEKDLSDFVGLVHDFKNDRKKIYDQIVRQIDNLMDYKIKNNSLDAIQLERKFLQVSHRIDQIAEELEELKFALFDDSECKMSVKELYLTSDLYQPQINLKQEYKFFDFDKVDQFMSTLKIFVAYAIRFNKEDHPWKNRVNFKNYAINDLNEIKRIINFIPEFQQQISVKSQELVNSPITLTEGEAILAKEEKIKELLRHLLNDEVFDYFRHMITFKDNETDYLWVGTMEKVVMECFKGAGPETTIDSKDLGVFQEALQRRIDAGKGIIKFIKWHLFSKEKNLVSQVLAANKLSSTKKDLRVLVEKIDNRLNLEHNLTKLRRYKSLKDVPADFDRENLETWFSNQKKAVLSKLIFSSLRNFKEYFNVQHLNYDELRQKIESLLFFLKVIPAETETWLRYLTPRQIHYILEDPNYGQKLLKTIQADFEDICEFDSLGEKLASHEQIILNKLLDETEELSEDAIARLFQNSIRLAWIEHIETKYPVLRGVSSMRFEKILSELQDCVKEKMKISGDIVLLRTRERTFENLEFNRLNNQVTYRDLKYQVSKKKKIWPLRKLFSNFYQELFHLLPCWMASPEAVSAIFPMEQVFDLVIFDEASQCFVERGIPAMYRGKQVVVAGDDKQLSPYDLYKVRWEEQTDDDPMLEIDSLLDLASQHLMQTMLKGHYRSQSPDLIDFSNFHFYDGTLTLLPEMAIMNRKQPAINYIKVDGIWENNMNHEEAVQTIALITKLIKEHPEKSIGVITFNYKQQNYIADLLDEAASNSKIQIPPTLIIKNIENVQGDEKDIIVFSTGYAPDKKGKLVMQFGSLNQEKGENRLNVAVTRAKEKIYIISSLLPHQLKTEGAKNEGPRLLKAYLQYAYDVSEGKYQSMTKPDKGHQPEWYLKNKIKNMFDDLPEAIKFNEDLTFADLSVSNGEKYIGAMLMDDTIYHDSISIKDSHVYKPFQLARRKWPYKQFFSREYWFNSEAVRENVIRFIKNSDDEQ